MTGSAYRYRFHITAAVAAAVVALLTMIAPRALAEDDILQKAINYVFTGKIDPANGPEIVNRKSCIVLVPDPRNNRSIRYYLSRFNMDRAHYDKIYVGRNPYYRLSIEGDGTIVEFLNADLTVAHGHRTAQIRLPGDLEQTQRALKLIADRCKAAKPKAPF